MLRTLGDAGYLVEWRVVNAAEYGFPQRRIRVFIVAHKGKSFGKGVTPEDYVTKKGILARALPANPAQLACTHIEIDEDAEKISKYFNKNLASKTPFQNSGVYVKGVAYTLKTEAEPAGTKIKTLGDVLQADVEVEDSFYIPTSQLKEWKFLKGAKSIERIHKGSGTKYNYAEGSMAFPDLLTKPSRTILTGEGGTSPSRFKHIIQTAKGFRRLTAVELERLNGFPDNWTELDDKGLRVSDTKRAFFMGNALVIGLVERVGKVLADEMKKG
jgi:DNA (cytosine-5)-methyltransferase 1